MLKLRWQLFDLGQSEDRTIFADVLVADVAASALSEPALHAVL
jgi:hypothetical protein